MITLPFDLKTPDQGSRISKNSMVSELWPKGCSNSSRYPIKQTNTVLRINQLNSCIHVSVKVVVYQCTNVENDRFSSGGSRPLGLVALMLMKVLNLFIVLKLHRNLRFLIDFEYYLIKNELENA